MKFEEVEHTRVPLSLAIRADASYAIGTGHIMRCLTLAEYVRSLDWRVYFISREHPGHACDLIEERGFSVYRLPGVAPSHVEGQSHAANYAAWLGVDQATDAEQTFEALRHFGKMPDWLLVDHYGIDRTWQGPLRSKVGGLFVVDDIANRVHDCDMLLDQNLHPLGWTRYRKLVPPDCLVLTGPEYALLREEFTEAGRRSRPRNGGIERVLIFFGGVDPTNETAKACQALLSLGVETVQVDVIVGGANPNREQIEQICASSDIFRYHCQVSNMAELMVAADLAIGAGGTTTWERAYLGLPSIVVAVADNQVPASEAMAQAEAAVYLGIARKVTSERIAAAVRHAITNPATVAQMSRNARALYGQDPIPGVARITGAMQARLSQPEEEYDDSLAGS